MLRRKSARSAAGRNCSEKGEASDPLIVLAEVLERDRRDREREMSPLVRAADAVVVDNTAMDAEETARVIVLLAQEKGKAAAGDSVDRLQPVS